MRLNLVTVIILTACIQVSARVGAQGINLKLENQSLEQAFKAIQHKTGYRFWYMKADLKSTRVVSGVFNKASIDDVLESIFKDQPLSYEVVDKVVTVKLKRVRPLGKLLDILTQKSIDGRVFDEYARPLAGATVAIKGKGARAITDKTGIFKLNANEGDVLVIDYVGYKTKEETVTAEQHFYIALEVSTSELDQVHIIAYGTTTKRFSTGNIGRVNSETISKQPVTNPLATLEGRIPGVVVTQMSGLAGAPFKVEIQGRTAIDRTITDDQPLFIIDGVPAPTNNNPINRQWSSLGSAESNGLYYGGRFTGLSPFSNLNPNDIESIDVLKGADATAIYGSRGANGVVLITTKKGKEGATKLGVAFNTGFSRIATKVNYGSTSQYLEWRRAAFASDGMAANDYNAYDIRVWDTNRYTNMSKLLTENTAKLTNANVSLSGGNYTTQYLISGGYRNQTTVMPGDNDSKNASLHFNISNNSVNEKFKMTFTGSYAHEDNEQIAYSDLTSLSSLPPNLRLHDERGELAWNEGGITTYDYLLPNPFAVMKQTYKVKSKNLSGSMQLSYAILNNLVLRANIGYSSIETDEANQVPFTSGNPLNFGQRSNGFNNNQFVSQIAEPQLEYNKQLSNNKLNVLVGGSYQLSTSEGTAIMANGYSNDDLLNSLVGFGSISASRFSTQYKYEAVFAQLNLRRSDKYILNLAARRDGSSKFGPDKKFSNFGSVGAAWIFTEEQFLKDRFSWLSFGKLRGSYGITGNDKITDYQYLDTWSATAWNYDGAPGLSPVKLFNGDYHWEKSNKLEAALELGFIKDRILLSANYYRNISSNPLVQYQLPVLTGFPSVVKNLPAKVSNTGWEFALTTINLETKNFSWTSNFNLTIPKNELLSFEDLDKSSYASTYVVGEPLNVIYGYKYLGVGVQSGVFEFDDLNKDGGLSTLDYQVLGNLSPRLYGGMNNSFKYKRLQFDFFLSFRKQTGFSYLNDLSVPGGMENLPAKMTGFWTKPGDDAQLQRLTQTYGTAYTAWYNMRVSGKAYEDASFVRLKNVSLSYQLPESWIKKIKISNARFFVQGQNLLTFTNYQVGDPETQSLRNTGPLKTIAFGLQCSL